MPTKRPARAPEPLWRDVLGEQLRRIRHDRGERLADTAERAGVSPQYLSEMERGLKEPSSEMIAAVAGALEVTLVDLTAAVVDELRRARRPVRGRRPGRALARRLSRTARRPPGAGRPAGRGIRPRASVASVSPAKSTGEILEIDGHEVRVSSPDKVVFPQPGLTKLDVVRYFLAVAPGALRGAGGRPDGAEALREGHRPGGVLPEARAREPPRLRRHRDPALRPRHLGRGGRDPGCRGPGVGRQPRMPRPQPASGARRGPRPPR